MAKPTYQELLQSPLWQRKRLEILQRDDWTCQWCGDTESQLHVHHKRYNKNKAPWDYPDTNLVCICDFCHKRHHFIVWFRKNGLNSLKFTGYDEDDCRRLFHYIDQKVAQSNDRSFVMSYIKDIRTYLESGTLILHLINDVASQKVFSAQLENAEASVIFNKRYPNEEDHYGTIWDVIVIDSPMDRFNSRTSFIGMTPSNEDAKYFFYMKTHRH